MALAFAQVEDDVPDWFHAIDPLDMLLLGAAAPKHFAGPGQFGNARTAWLDLLRKTRHWADVERFVEVVVEFSGETDLPIDHGDLLLLVVPRLEAAGLDKRTLPESLRPGPALANARFVRGPAEDLVLPAPTIKSTGQAQRFLAELDAGTTHDGSCAAELRDAMWLLNRLEFPVLDESALLITALYAGLVAGDDEPIEELCDRSVDWALGLRETSSLIPVVDTIFVASRRGFTVENALSHLYMIPAFTRKVDAEDRRWRSGPGTEFVPLAMALGHRRIETRDASIVSLAPSAVAMITAERQLSEERLGRPPAPDDPIFFAGDGHASALARDEEFTDWMSRFFNAARIHPGWAYAFLHEGAPLPSLEGKFNSARDRRGWDKAIDKYVQLHPDDGYPDFEVELGKLRAANALMLIKFAAENPAFAGRFIAMLDDGDGDHDVGVEIVSEFLFELEDELVAAFDDDAKTRARTRQLAIDWGGEVLAARVEEGLEPDRRDDELIDDVVLFVLAAAFMVGRSDNSDDRPS